MKQLLKLREKIKISLNKDIYTYEVNKALCSDGALQ